MGKVAYVHQVRVKPNWIDTIVLFLREDILPADKLEADKVRRKGASFLAIRGTKIVQALIFWAVFTLHSP